MPPAGMGITASAARRGSAARHDGCASGHDGGTCASGHDGWASWYDAAARYDAAADGDAASRHDAAPWHARASATPPIGTY